MKKSPKPYISPLEVEIDAKLSNAYLFSVAARAGQIDFPAILKEVSNPSTKTSLTDTPSADKSKTEYGITKLFSQHRKSFDRRKKADLYRQIVAQVKKHR